jgi:hypothetical protein
MYTSGTCATGLGAFFPGSRLLYALHLGDTTPLGGTLTLTTCGHSANNTVLYVGTGCPTWALPFACKAGNDNAAAPSCGGNPLASTVAVVATQPVYYVQLGGMSGSPVVSGLGWSYAPPPSASPAAAPARSNASAAVEPASPLSVVMGLRAAPHMLVPLGDGVAVRVRLGVVVRERLPLLDGVPVGDAVGVAAAVSEPDVDAVSVGDADSDAVADAEPVAESVLLGVPDAEPVQVAERVDDPVAGGVAEAVGVTLRLGGNACASDRPPPAAPARTGRPRMRPPVARRPASAAIAASQLPAAAAPPPGTALRSTPLRDCMSGISPVTLEKSTQLASASMGESMLPHAESAACPSGAVA